MPVLTVHSAMFASEDVGFGKRQSERFERHRLIVIEKCFANAEELRFGGRAENMVQELAIRIHAKADEVEVAFHLLDLGRLADLRRLYGGVEFAHVLKDIATARDKQWLPALVLANLVEEPRIAYSSATDHEPARAGHVE